MKKRKYYLGNNAFALTAFYSQHSLVGRGWEVVADGGEAVGAHFNETGETNI